MLILTYLKMMWRFSPARSLLFATLLLLSSVTQSIGLVLLVPPLAALPKSQTETSGVVAAIVEGLGQAGLNRPGKGGSWARSVLEKPPGHDLVNAGELNRAGSRGFDEERGQRIRHHLGEAAVQDLAVFRLPQPMFEAASH